MLFFEQSFIIATKRTFIEHLSFSPTLWTVGFKGKLEDIFEVVKNFDLKGSIINQIFMINEKIN